MTRNAFGAGGQHDPRWVFRFSARRRASSYRQGGNVGSAQIHFRRSTAARTQRFKEPMPAEGPIVRWIPGAALPFNARGAREVDAGSCEQSGVRQSVAGIAVVEKNRCIRMIAPGRGAAPFGVCLQGLAGTISGTIEGTVGGRLSRDLVYT
jgi:hypothetical protein